MTKAHEPSSSVAVESKLEADGSTQPGSVYVHVSSSTLADETYESEAESVHPS